MPSSLDAHQLIDCRNCCICWQLMWNLQTRSRVKSFAIIYCNFRLFLCFVICWEALTRKQQQQQQHQKTKQEPKMWHKPKITLQRAPNKRRHRHKLARNCTQSEIASEFSVARFLEWNALRRKRFVGLLARAPSDQMKKSSKWKRDSFACKD